MNYRMVIWLLGIVSILLGIVMAFSIPWGFESWGGDWENEKSGVIGLLLSMAACFFCGSIFLLLGRNAKIQLFRKEALAVVALSWILATVLGALPYVLSRVERTEQVKMSMIDAMFEAQSGFSTTGATVLSNVENREMLPRCILFWRGSTHFLGGIGIMLLLVALLGQGAVSKSVFRAERSGSPGDGTKTQTKVHNLAWILFYIYVGLNMILTLILFLEGVPIFDAICHAFSTLATGGFSTYNASAGEFITNPKFSGARIEWTLILFMILGGTNFLLLYWCLLGKPGKLFADTEFRTYLGLILVATLIIATVGYFHGDFNYYGTSDKPILLDRRTVELEPPDVTKNTTLGHGLRTSCFQVVSMMTTTGFCTDEFENWAGVSCGILLLVMLTGACSGSTAGGMKIIRVVLNFKIFSNEIERSYRPNVVRNIWLQKEVVDRDLLSNVVIFSVLYFALIIIATLIITGIEPDFIWSSAGLDPNQKLTDCLSAVVSCQGNVGPGFGIVGARHNYGCFTSLTKLILTATMLIGRLEIFTVLVIFSPTFWRNH